PADDRRRAAPARLPRGVMESGRLSSVIAGLDPAIQGPLWADLTRKPLDARVKPGHDNRVLDLLLSDSLE
ncbi:MAG TPA: hypothetical protein VIQ53_11155, partial [Inquilinus sp.]